MNEASLNTALKPQLEFCHNTYLTLNPPHRWVCLAFQQQRRRLCCLWGPGIGGQPDKRMKPANVCILYTTCTVQTVVRSIKDDQVLEAAARQCLEVTRMEGEMKSMLVTNSSTVTGTVSTRYKDILVMWLYGLNFLGPIC